MSGPTGGRPGGREGLGVEPYGLRLQDARPEKSPRAAYDAWAGQLLIADGGRAPPRATISRSSSGLICSSWAYVLTPPRFRIDAMRAPMPLIWVRSSGFAAGSGAAAAVD